MSYFMMNLDHASAQTLAQVVAIAAKDGIEWTVGDSLGITEAAPKPTKVPKESAAKKPDPVSKKPATKALDNFVVVPKQSGKAGHKNEVFLDRNVPKGRWQELVGILKDAGAVYDPTVETDRPSKKGGMAHGGFRFTKAANAKAFVASHATITLKG